MVVSVPSWVSVHWLRDHLDDPGVAIADCRFALADPALGASQYAAAHIPGAIHFDLNRDLSAPVEKHGGRHPLPDPQALAQRLAAAGISTETPTTLATWVVVYDDSRLGVASRLWWLLRWLGHERVSILDGGWAAWNAAGYPTTTETTWPQPGVFCATPRMEWVAGLEEVRSPLPASLLIDSREGARYRGEQEPIDPVAGHIPGAVNYPWQGVTDEQGYVRSPAEQRQRWADLAADLEQTDRNDAERRAIVYCGSGVTACVNLFSMHLAGFSPARIYAGSWSDWCSYPELPIATGADPGRLDGVAPVSHKAIDTAADIAQDIPTAPDGSSNPD